MCLLKKMLAKFICCFARLHIVTRRYMRINQVIKRSYFVGKKLKLKTKHICILCPSYADFPNVLYSKAVKHNDQFHNLSYDENFMFFFRNE